LKFVQFVGSRTLPETQEFSIISNTNQPENGFMHVGYVIMLSIFLDREIGKGGINHGSGLV